MLIIFLLKRKFIHSCHEWDHTIREEKLKTSFVGGEK